MSRIRKTPTFDPTERNIGCNIYGSIGLIDPISSIVDTPQFQRLRYIKQLGSADLVFPTGNHTRFTHSLGVYHLSLKFAKRLWDRNPTRLDATDVLCVAIAGLIHDLGHGPFSHTFDGPFMKRNNKGVAWKHEEGTIAMWRHLLAQNPETKDTLDLYLDAVDYKFIEELIMPPKKLVVDGKWVIEGRPRSKSFLFSMISNPFDGLDCDKMDYFLRDSQNAKISSDFDLAVVERICSHIDICADNEFGCDRMGYEVKTVEEINIAFNARTKLYEILYKHNACLSVEEMIIEILSLASPFIKFPGSDGKLYTMVEAVHNMSAYELMTDSILAMIKISTDPNLLPAKELLKMLERRKIYRCIGKSWSKNSTDADKNYNSIQEFMRVKLPEAAFFMRKCEMHQGLGLEEHPLDKVAFYKQKSPVKKAMRLSNLRSEVCKSSGRIKILVYLRQHDHPQRQELQEELEDFIYSHLESQNSSTPDTPSKPIPADTQASTASTEDLLPEEYDGPPKRFRSAL